MYNGKNYSTDGGDTWVIGGKLTIVDGATLEGIGKQAAAVADCSGTAVADVKTTLNALLAALRTAGILAPNAET